MLNSLICALRGGHDYALQCGPGAIFLQCDRCRARTLGWSFEVNPPTMPARQTAPAPAPAAECKVQVLRFDGRRRHAAFTGNVSRRLEQVVRTIDAASEQSVLAAKARIASDTDTTRPESIDQKPATALRLSIPEDTSVRQPLGIAGDTNAGEPLQLVLALGPHGKSGADVDSGTETAAAAAMPVGTETARLVASRRAAPVVVIPFVPRTPGTAERVGGGRDAHRAGIRSPRLTSAKQAAALAARRRLFLKSGTQKTQVETTPRFEHVGRWPAPAAVHLHMSAHTPRSAGGAVGSVMPGTWGWTERSAPGMASTPNPVRQFADLPGSTNPLLWRHVEDRGAFAAHLNGGASASLGNARVGEEASHQAAYIGAVGYGEHTNRGTEIALAWSRGEAID